MIAAILFIAVVGLFVGSYWQRGSHEQGWCLLTMPLSAVIIGVPLAIAMALLLWLLPDPIIGLEGAWRAIPLRALLYASVSTAIYLRQDRDMRAATAPGHAIRRAFFGAFLGCVWLVLNRLL